MGFLGVMGLMAGLVLALAARPSAAGAPPARPKRSCAELRADVERSSKAVGMPMVLKAGDWGKTPAPLRALPPKASLCGSSEMNAMIASPLTGKDLESYYTPILVKMGCKKVECELGEKKTSCSCRVTGGFARIGTEELSEAYDISWLPF